MNQGTINFIFKTADDSFIFGHRNSEWTGLGPFIEEDIAFASMAQDKIGHAWVLYKMLNEHAGLEDAEKLAFYRDINDFRNAHLVELPNGEYDFSLLRHFLFDEAEFLRYDLLLNSSFAPLAHMAKKFKGELKYHTMHAESFMIQLGQGSEESNTRMQKALDAAFPYALGLFESYEGESEVIAEGVFPGEEVLKAKWLERITPIIVQANLKMPDVNANPIFGGRQKQHTEHFAPMMHEMREVSSTDPNATW
ncbi:MAG: phenylacetate-CoA oxygenase subunit PaaC [Bacteroidota bacterium]|jgi:ring-1,2-phenylacetyl-CoA epoxidase subunit PaaC